MDGIRLSAPSAITSLPYVAEPRRKPSDVGIQTLKIKKGINLYLKNKNGYMGKLKGLWGMYIKKGTKGGYYE